MCFVKAHYPRDKFEAIFAELWYAMWREGINIEKPELMKQTLLRHFTESQADEIMKGANSKQYKDQLLATTKYCVENGAFGCPWFFVTNSKGTKEPFFGSDRYDID